MNLRALLALCLLASPAAAQGLSPQEAVKKMTVPDGFEVRLVASGVAQRSVAVPAQSQLLGLR